MIGLWQSRTIRLSVIWLQDIYLCLLIDESDFLLDAHLGEDKLTLEGFSLTLASPDTQDEWDLNFDLAPKLRPVSEPD
jgi:hypothetical protein